MRLSVCPQPFYELGLDAAVDGIAALGFEALEIPVDAGSPLVDLEELLAGAHRRLRKRLQDAKLEISAISNHREGQLLLGPHHRDTDGVFQGTPEEKSAYARDRLVKSARLASELEIPVLVGFVGCEDYTRSFPWPDPGGWERMQPRFQDVVGGLLDEIAALGVGFAHEPHPKQFVYNIETALESVELLDHAAWGFNYDPANLMLAGVDPVVFVAELGERIRHVHAKDGEIVPHNVHRSGLLAHGPWDRRDRGFRFRIPGWGDLSWKRVISELRLAGYDGWVAIENEDPVFEPMDGFLKALAELQPLLPSGERRDRWW